MPAKKSNKQRKFGRNTKDAPAQRRRSSMNKARRMFHEELKAGRELVWTNIAGQVMEFLHIYRAKAKATKIWPVP